MENKLIEITSTLKIEENGNLSHIPERINCKVRLRYRNQGRVRYFLGNFSLNFLSSVIHGLNSNFFGLRKYFLWCFVACWMPNFAFKYFFIWCYFVIDLLVVVLTYLPLSLPDDVPDFSEGSELFHVVTPALNGVPCFEELGHSFKNFIESEG